MSRPNIMRGRDGGLTTESCYLLLKHWVEEDDWNGQDAAEWRDMLRYYTIVRPMRGTSVNPKIEHRMNDEGWRPMSWENRVNYPELL